MESHPIETLSRLAQLGIPPEVFPEALLDGHAARAACTPLHPRGFRGMAGWAEIVEGVRQRLVALGWKPMDTADGLALIVSPNGSFAVAVSSGDINTGNPEKAPTTRYRKGWATFRAVERNEQLELLGPQPVVLKNPGATAINRTYFLLFAETGDEIRSELSLPLSIGDDGRPCAWSERNILAPISIKTDALFGDDDDQEELVVEVTRKN